MTDRIQVRVYGDADKARLAVEELTLKGYHAEMESARVAVLNGLDVGGHLDTLSDVDDKVYLVIGRK